MSTRLSVVLVAVLFGLLCCSTTGHGQLLAGMFSSGIDIDQGPIITRRSRQSTGISAPISTTVEQQNNINPNHPPLTCHRCRSFEDGDRCTHLPANSSIFQKTCGPQHTSCMVKRFSYTTNATSAVELWSIERNCSTKCEPGCLILGDRTKLYACISCCNENSCNTGNGANNRRSLDLVAIISCYTIVFLLLTSHKNFVSFSNLF